MGRRHNPLGARKRTEVNICSRVLLTARNNKKLCSVGRTSAAEIVCSLAICEQTRYRRKTTAQAQLNSVRQDQTSCEERHISS
jgi:hypothetical protein